MTTQKPAARKATATRNRAAIDSSTKKPRIVSVDFVLDDEKADDYEKALKALETAERKLMESRPRRVAAVRAALPPGMDPEEQARAMAHVHTEDDLKLDELRARLEEATEAMEAATRWYKFRALGRQAWEDMKARHPATEDDHQATREATGKEDDRASWHFDSLAPELIREAAVSPKLTEADVDEIFNGGDWNDPEISRLFQHALMPQVSARPNPMARR